MRSRTVRLNGSIAAVMLALLCLAGCQGVEQAEAARRGSGGVAANPSSPPVPPARLQTRSSALVEAGPVCPAPGAHAKHASLGYTCQQCHPCGGALALASLTFPSGTSSSSGVVTNNAPGTAATCAGACHSPFGANSPTISWTTPGPLPCTACHSNVIPPQGTIVSSHAFDFSNAFGSRAACQSCHDTSSHMSGNVMLITSSGTINASCEACHSPNSTPLNGKTPPLLVGWAAGGNDWHGARAGTGAGFSGTLLPPYRVGQGPIACPTCHDPHVSTNAFLIAPTVNGYPVAQNAISRAGVGAEDLCSACHAGPHHSSCMTQCHDHNGNKIGHVTDPAPPGAACFFCHGHEGVRSDFQDPVNGCNHCHDDDGVSPPTWFQAPFVATPVVFALTSSGSGTNATITWYTDQPASGYLELGPTFATIYGSGDVSGVHSVTLSGLTGGATYTYRVRSSDLFRNDVTSSAYTFTPGAPPAPQPWGVPPYYDVAVPTPVALHWNPVSIAGETTQYQAQVSTSPTFATLTYSSGWITATGATPTLATNSTYYFRVQARGSVHQVPSDWSIIVSFIVTSQSECDVDPNSMNCQ